MCDRHERPEPKGTFGKRVEVSRKVLIFRTNDECGKVTNVIYLTP